MKTLKETFLHENSQPYMSEADPAGWNVDTPSFEDLVDRMVDIFDDMMKGIISDQKYQKLIDDDIWFYAQDNEKLFKKILIAAKTKVLKQTDQFLSREVQQQTD